ncbi:MAG: hypothetical protein ACJA2W_001419 [Planctomycetota bacterium]|jgi:hypothetical protein
MRDAKGAPSASQRNFMLADEGVSVIAPGHVRQVLDKGLNELIEMGTVEVLMVPSVPCSGTVVRPTSADATENSGRVWISLQKLDGDASQVDWVQLDTVTWMFEKDGLTSGRYQATYGGFGGDGPTAEFDLPEGGSTELVLDFSGQ